jgi:hypothetical protein
MLKLKINHVKVGNHLAGFIVLILFGGEGGVVSLRGKGVFTVRMFTKS